MPNVKFQKEEGSWVGVLIFFVIIGAIFGDKDEDDSSYNSDDSSYNSSYNSSDNSSSSTYSLGQAEIVSTNRLIIRSSPDINSSEIVIVPNNKIVTVLFCKDEYVYEYGKKGAWCKVKFNGNEGWAWGWHLHLLDD